MAKTIWESEKEYYNAILDYTFNPEKYISSVTKKELKKTLTVKEKNPIKKTKKEDDKKEEAGVATV